MLKYYNLFTIIFWWVAVISIYSRHYHLALLKKLQIMTEHICVYLSIWETKLVVLMRYNWEQYSVSPYFILNIYKIVSTKNRRSLALCIIVKNHLLLTARFLSFFWIPGSFLTGLLWIKINHEFATQLTHIFGVFEKQFTSMGQV